MGNDGSAVSAGVVTGVWPGTAIDVPGTFVPDPPVVVLAPAGRSLAGAVTARPPPDARASSLKGRRSAPARTTPSPGTAASVAARRPRALARSVARRRPPSRTVTLAPRRRPAPVKRTRSLPSGVQRSQAPLAAATSPAALEACWRWKRSTTRTRPTRVVTADQRAAPAGMRRRAEKRPLRAVVARTVDDPVRMATARPA